LKSMQMLYENDYLFNYATDLGSMPMYIFNHFEINANVMLC